MLLAIDIGNTNITLGLYEGDELYTAWRLATVHERMPDEYGLQLLGLLEACNCLVYWNKLSVLSKKSQRVS
jgi:type III pantothenate kinase